MSKTFVLAIGGTGSRVVRALTMLLASGVVLKNTDKIIPIIIDVDAKNADTERALSALANYKAIRNAGFMARKAANGSEILTGFFNTNLNTLSSLQTEGDGHQRIKDSFQLHFENMERSFIKYIDPDEELQDDITMDLLRALYDDTPPGHPNFHNTELYLQLNHGFKGNPNIGSVVFNNLSRSAEYQFMLRGIGKNDRVFIISSIFGGTGSSGFPQLVKLLKAEERLNFVKFGALTVMPYYKIAEKKKDKKEATVNSDTFDAKTEAALTYYAKYLKGRIDLLYQIWDEPVKQYDNNEGGEDQLNPAHIVELIGAAAVIDFVNKPDDAFPAAGQTQFYDFGIKRKDAAIDITHFYDTTRNDIMHPLTLFAYAMKIFMEYLPGLNNEVFYKDFDLTEKLRSDVFYQTLSSFFKDHFKTWLREMANNERGFVPFNLEAELNSFITGRQITIRKIGGLTLNAGLSESFLNEKLGKINDELKKTIHDTEIKKRFIRLLNEVAGECYKVLGSLPVMIN